MRHVRTSPRSAVPVLTGLILLGSTGTAHAADTIRPSLSVQGAGLTPGSAVSSEQGDDGGNPSDVYFHYGWTSTLTWSAYDASGICRQVLESVTAYYQDEPDYQPLPATQRSATFSFFSDNIGRGADFYMRVHVYDCAGNETVGPVIPLVDRFIEEDQGVQYSAGWSVAKCSCFAAGKTRYTTKRGARATFNAEGGPVAVTMERKFDRGKVNVLVDGKRSATVDTGSSAGSPAVHSAVVWTAHLTPGTHTVEIVNLATPGRPRVDLDVRFN